MRFPKDGNFISVTIKRFTGGSIDKITGNWQESDTVLVAEADIDLQPKTGSGSDSFRDSSYNKIFTGFIGILDITFSCGFSKIMRGDIINQKYKVLDVKDWLTHYELLLEQL